MPQHDYVIDNQAGASFRADVNNVLLAIVANNSGATEPATMYAHMWWADTTANILKRRNAGNTAWISVMSLSLAISTFAETLLDDTSASAMLTTLGFSTYGKTLIDDADAAAARTTLGIVSDPYVYIRDEKANGTSGGSSTAGAYQTRTLNTEVSDTGSNATLTTNQVQLAAGTYRVRARAPALKANRHRIRLRNVTASTTLLVGSSGYSPASVDFAYVDATLNGRITVAASQWLEVQHYIESAQTVNGLGNPCSSGDVEVYTEIEFWKEQ